MLTMLEIWKNIPNVFGPFKTTLKEGCTCKRWYLGFFFFTTTLREGLFMKTLVKIRENILNVFNPFRSTLREGLYM